MSAMRARCVVAIAIAALSACSRSTKTSTSSTTSVPTTPYDKLLSAILVPSDVAPGYKSSGFTPSREPEPCGQPNIDTAYPPQGKASIELAKGSFSLTEAVEVYSSATTAAAAEIALEDGYTCGSGTFYNSAGNPINVVLQSPTDETSLVGAEKATLVTMSSDAANATVILVLINDAVARLIFQSPTSANSNDAGTNPVNVTTTAVRKLKTAGV